MGEAMKQRNESKFGFGDVVTYVRNGVEVKALVFSSTMQQVTVPAVANDFQKRNGLTAPGTTELEEHLSLLYLDPVFAKALLSGTEMDRSVARAIGAMPLKEGRTTGWKALEAEAGGPELEEGALFVADDGQLSYVGNVKTDKALYEACLSHMLALKAAETPSYTEHTDGDFSQDGDPYGIAREYTSKSFGGDAPKFDDYGAEAGLEGDQAAPSTAPGAAALAIVDATDATVEPTATAEDQKTQAETDGGKNENADGHQQTPRESVERALDGINDAPEQAPVQPGTTDRKKYIMGDESDPEFLDTVHVNTVADEKDVTGQAALDKLNEPTPGVDVAPAGETHQVMTVVNEMTPDVAEVQFKSGEDTEKFAAEPQAEAYAKGEDHPHEQDHAEPVDESESKLEEATAENQQRDEFKAEHEG